MLTVRAYTAEGEIEDVASDHEASFVDRDNVLVWADLVDPTDEERDRICTMFDLHHLSVEDMRKHRQRPKFDQYDDHAFIVAYGVVDGVSDEHPDDAAPDRHHLDETDWTRPGALGVASLLAEVDVVVGKNWVLTVRERTEAGVVDIDRLVRTMRAEVPKAPTVGVMLHAVLDSLVDGYFDLSDEADRRLSDLEGLIFAGEEPAPGRDEAVASTQTERDLLIQRAMLSLRNDLVQVRRRVAPLYDVLQSVLRGEACDLDRDTTFHMQDVVDHVLRITEAIDVHHEMLSNAFDAHLALVAQYTNDTMKKMTAWASILLGSTLIAGIYGMNFNDMPELRWQFGYPAALSTMLLLSAALFISFRRRRWL